MASAFASVLLPEAKAEIQHYLDHDEPELAFEGLVLELIGSNVSPGHGDRQAWLSLATRLGLEDESVLVGDLWQRLNAWLDRHDESFTASSS